MKKRVVKKDPLRLRVLIEKAERSSKYEWKLISKNNYVVCVSEKLFIEKNGALHSAERFCKLVNNTKDLKVDIA